MCFSSKVLFYSDVRIEIGYFERSGGIGECHAMLHVTDTQAPFAKQFGDISAAYFYRCPTRTKAGCSFSLMKDPSYNPCLERQFFS